MAASMNISFLFILKFSLVQSTKDRRFAERIAAWNYEARAIHV